MVKNLPASARDASLILGWEDLLEEEMGTHSFSFLPGKFHGQRSLVGYSLSMGYKESGTTEYRAQYMQTCREHSPMTLKHYKIAEDIIIHF